MFAFAKKNGDDAVLTKLREEYDKKIQEITSIQNANNSVLDISAINNKNKTNYYHNLIKETDINTLKTKDEVHEYLWLYYSYMSSLLDETAKRASRFKNKNINSYYRYFTKFSTKLYKQTREVITKNSNKSIDDSINNVIRFCSNKKSEVYNKINNFNNIISNNHGVN